MPASDPGVQDGMEDISSYVNCRVVSSIINDRVHIPWWTSRKPLRVDGNRQFPPLRWTDRDISGSSCRTFDTASNSLVNQFTRFMEITEVTAQTS